MSSIEPVAILRSSELPDRPRLCIVSELWYPSGGGVGTYGRALVERFVAAGIKVLVITRRDGRDLPVLEHVGRNVTVYRLLPSGSGRFKKYLMIPHLLWELLCTRNRYDVIYVFGLRVLGPPCVLAARLLNKRCILRAEVAGEISGDREWLPGRESNSGFAHWLGKAFISLRNWINARAHALVSISEEIHHEFLAAGVPSDRLIRIPNGVDTDRFVPVEPDERIILRRELTLPSGPLVVFTGRLHPVKGVDVLLDVWNKVIAEYPNAHLVLIGEGATEGDLRRIVQRDGLSSHVTFTGQIENVLGYLQCADVFVLPSRREGLSISLLEAMACGLPAVATRTSGSVEVVHDRRTGRLVGINDPDALAGALLELLSAPERTQLMGQAARRHVREHYDITASVAQHQRMFSASPVAAT